MKFGRDLNNVWQGHMGIGWCHIVPIGYIYSIICMIFHDIISFYVAGFCDGLPIIQDMDDQRSRIALITSNFPYGQCDQFPLFHLFYWADFH